MLISGLLRYKLVGMSIPDIFKKINKTEAFAEGQPGGGGEVGLSSIPIAKRKDTLYLTLATLSIIFLIAAMGEGAYLTTLVQRPRPIEVTCDPELLKDMNLDSVANPTEVGKSNAISSVPTSTKTIKVLKAAKKTKTVSKPKPKATSTTPKKVKK